MSKGLKALRKIKNVEVVDDERDDFNTFPITAYLKEELSIIEKDLDVLEIIKKKKVNVALLTVCSVSEQYNYCICKSRTITNAELLTETEFNLIKEWFER